MEQAKSQRPEKLIIRPPSEWRSLLLRSTRGCNWNRCRFCGIYAALGEPEFSIRPVDEVMGDIDRFAGRSAAFQTAFIGDADPLCRDLDESVSIVSRLRERLPHLRRVTAYARAGTLYKIGGQGLRRLVSAGLDRVHTGLESGDLQTLKFHRKGQSPKLVAQAAHRAAEAGLSVSFYVLLGLGGRDRWREHIDATATLINRTDPDFVRVRRIWLFTPRDTQTAAACPLWEDIRAGRFEQQTPEGTVLELRRLVEGIQGVHTHLVCDHANNYVAVEGRVEEERERMIGEIDTFLALPVHERERHYRAVGSRL